MQPNDARVMKLMLAIAKEEKSIELIRQTLSQQPQFEPYAAFLYLDKEKCGYLTITSIKTFLSYSI